MELLALIGLVTEQHFIVFDFSALSPPCVVSFWESTRSGFGQQPHRWILPLRTLLHLSTVGANVQVMYWLRSFTSTTFSREVQSCATYPNLNGREYVVDSFAFLISQSLSLSYSFQRPYSRRFATLFVNHRPLFPTLTIATFWTRPSVGCRTHRSIT